MREDTVLALDGVFTFSLLNHESDIQYPCLSKCVTACRIESIPWCNIYGQIAASVRPRPSSWFRVGS